MARGWDIRHYIVKKVTGPVSQHLKNIWIVFIQQVCLTRTLSVVVFGSVCVVFLSVSVSLSIWFRFHFSIMSAPPSYPLWILISLDCRVSLILTPDCLFCLVPGLWFCTSAVSSWFLTPVCTRTTIGVFGLVGWEINFGLFTFCLSPCHSLTNMPCLVLPHFVYRLEGPPSFFDSPCLF